MKHKKITAIILAAGQGKRMESKIHKQYMELAGKPLIWYALQAFENSIIDDVILVAGAGEVDYCKKEIVEFYDFHKVSAVVEGGRERYHSVYEGLKAVRSCEYVLVHDGARPLVSQQIISRAADGAAEFGACVIAMPVKDTIKISDEDDFACVTPARNHLWQIQTPQAFSYDLIFHAYQKLLSREDYQNGITDDAMVIETMTDTKVKLIPGSYQNIKVTTPEDILIADTLLKADGIKGFS